MRRARGARDALREHDARRRWSAHARGAVELAEGDAQAALPPCASARQIWQELDAPYEVARRARARGAACRALGDADAAALELEAARARLRAAGAGPTSCALDASGARPTRTACRARELESFASSRRARATARSRRRSSSASTRSPVTCRTSSRSSMSPLARPRPLRLRARPRLTRRVVRTDHAAAGAKLVDPRDARDAPAAYRRCRTRRRRQRWHVSRAVRHGDHRRRPGGARGRLPPAQAGSVVRDPRRGRASRRHLAEALGFAAAVLAGALRRAARDAVPGAADIVPDDGRDGRLPRGLRRALRLPVGRASRSTAREGGDRLRRHRRRPRSRPTTSSSRLASCRSRTSRASPPSSIPRIRQLHSSDYRNPAQLQPGGVLVVGASHSGGDIALEAAAEHETILSGRIPARSRSLESRGADGLPRCVLPRHPRLTVDTPIGRKVQPRSSARRRPLIR